MTFPWIVPAYENVLHKNISVRVLRGVQWPMQLDQLFQLIFQDKKIFQPVVYVFL